jgi:amino acid adenylation domain-containing protein
MQVRRFMADITDPRIAERDATVRSAPLQACAHACAHHRVHAQALETPGAPAIVAGDRVISYEELDTRANALAAELRGKGAGPETVVGLLARRSPEMVIGALAILKAGAAYLPLDASYPSDRLAYVLGDARVALLLCTPGLAERVTDVAPGAIVPVELDGPRAEAPPSTDVTAEHLAYVIYTSGSTGKPKGVEITHASLQNLIRWHQRRFDVKPADRATQIASVGFDAAVWEIWPYLAAGACLHIPPEALRTDPDALREWLLAHEITITFVPTPMAGRLIAHSWPAKASLRTMLTGGDVLHAYPPPGLPFVLVNNYGPTECTVVATSGTVETYGQPDRRPPIGRPIDGTTIHLLDDGLNAVPAGSVGEVYVGGAGLARGYRNRPELTEARFVRQPATGERLYRTGDLARELPDGCLAFVGRADDQIKVQGFRIEPNEIVTALAGHPGVSASAVVASDVGGGDKRLVAYVVLAEGAQVTPSDLQATLRRSLPDYMVPGIYVRLDALPLDPHGKVARAGLPEPTPANTLRDAVHVKPRTLVEERISELVRGLWRIDDIGVDDNLFLLGGHSLIATQLIGRIRQAFGVEMGLRMVFEAPSVALLSAEVERLLLAKVGAMTDEEARALLGAAPPVEDAAQ